MCVCLPMCVRVCACVFMWKPVACPVLIQSKCCTVTYTEIMLNLINFKLLNIQMYTHVSVPQYKR